MCFLLYMTTSRHWTKTMSYLRQICFASNVDVTFCPARSALMQKSNNQTAAFLGKPRTISNTFYSGQLRLFECTRL